MIALWSSEAVINIENWTQIEIEFIFPSCPYSVEAADIFGFSEQYYSYTMWLIQWLILLIHTCVVVQCKQLNEPRLVSDGNMVIVNRFARGYLIIYFRFKQIQSVFSIFKPQDSVFMIICYKCISYQFVSNGQHGAIRLAKCYNYSGIVRLEMFS